MPRLKKPRYELFALEMAKGKSQAQAAIAAGYSASDAGPRGCKLAKRQEIRARIEELRPTLGQVVIAKAVAVTAIDKASIMQSLWAIAHDRSEPTSSRVRCLELCGRELGLFADRRETEMRWDGDL